MNYQKIIENLFPKLIIRQPLFYSWNIGLRFELNNEYKGEIYGNNYFENILKKTTTLYEKALDPLDDVLVIYQEYTGSNYRKFNKKNFCFQNINQPKNIEYSDIKGLYDSTDEDDYWTQSITKTKAENINHSKILTAISNNDFNKREPRINGNVFFLNISKELIFHMYDDRGLDIVSTKKDTLKELYNKYNSWILDYDRERIDNIFGIKKKRIP